MHGGRKKNPNRFSNKAATGNSLLKRGFLWKVPNRGKGVGHSRRGINHDAKWFSTFLTPLDLVAITCLLKSGSWPALIVANQDAGRKKKNVIKRGSLNISLFTRGYFFLLFILVFSSLKRIMNVVHPVLTAERKQFNYCNDNYKVYARQAGRDDGRVGLEKLLNRMENAFDAL